MHYVYLLRSIPNPNQTYVGHTKDLKIRLQHTTTVSRLTHQNSNLGGWLHILRSMIKLKHYRLKNT
jgi:predicted GIY-YIG superfamily endonuclease